MLASRIEAATYYWDTNGATAGSGASTGSWDGATANWTTDATGATTPGVSLTTSLDDLIFSAGSNGTTGTVTVSGAQLANSITFKDNVAVTLSGGTSITLGGAGSGSGIFVSSGDNAANTISTPVILNGSTSTFAFTNDGTGLLTVGAITGAATSGTQTINVSSTSSGGITLNGIIGNGAGGGKVALVVNNTGAGITTLSGANTFTGGTTINAGTLQITQTTSAASTGTFNLGGGTFQINQAGNNFGYSSTINLTADSTFSSIGAGAINWTGTLNGNNHVLNANSGATRVYLNGTFNNVTQINITAGAVGLDLASAGHESTPVVVSSGASLWFANATNTLASNITLNGGAGLGSTGALALEGGTNLTPVLSGTLTLNSGNSSIGNAGTANAGNNISITGKVTGTGSLTKISINRLTLSNATNDYSGSTTITGGVLQANDGVGLPTGSFLSLDGGVLQSNNSSASFTRSLGTSGSGNFQFTANGGGFSANGGQLTVNIGGATAGQTWGSTVGTNLVGTLQFGSVSANAKTLFQNAIDLNGGTRTINVTAGTGGDSAEISGAITNSTGTSGLTKTGTGTLILSGSNTYNGITTISTGTLQFGNGSTTGSLLSSGTISIAATATLAINRSNPVAQGTDFGAISGTTGILTQLGTGALTLTGSNSITTLNVNNATGTVDIGSGNTTIANAGGNAIQSTTGGTINATGGGTLTLTQQSATDGGNVGTANGTTLTINAKITGANAFESFNTNNGTGVVVLTNTGNNFTGNVVINSGVVQVSAVGNQSAATSILGSGTTISIGSGSASTGALKYTGTGEVSNRIINLSGSTSGGTIDASGASGTLELSSNLTAIAGAKTLTLTGTGLGKFSGNLVNSSGTISVTKTGAGAWILSGTNSYTGLTTVNGGTLTLSGNNTTSGGVTLTTGTLNINAAGTSSSNSALGTGTLTITSGTIDNTNAAFTGALATNNVVIVNGDFAFAGTNNLNLGTGAVTLTNTGTRIITIGGSSSTLTMGGQVTASNQAGNTTLTVNGIGNSLLFSSASNFNSNQNTTARTFTVNGSGNVTINGLLTSTTPTASLLAYSGTGKLTLAAGYAFTGTSTIASGGTVQLGNGATAVTMSGGITNSGTLIYDPNAAFTSTAVTGTGAVTIIGGQTVKKTTSLSTGLLTLGDSSTTGTLDLNGTAQTVGGLSNGSFTPASDSIVNTGAAAALTIDTTNGSQSFGGAISPATANLISLVKTGNNTQTFNGTTASTFTGGITVNGGTLALNEANVAGTNNLVSSSNALTLGGGTLSVSGGTQTLASLATTANTTSFLTLGANSTLTIASATQSFGAGSLLTLDTSAGGANGATVGNAIMVWNTGTAGSIINNAFLVTDAGGTGFATKNGSNQIIRLNTTLLPASGAVSTTNYFIDNNTGGTAAAGSNTLTLSASEAANSISVDTTARSGTLDLGAGSFTLSNNNWSFAGANTYTINPGTGGNLKTVATGNAFVFDNVASGLVTINAPVLAFGSNAVTFNGTGTTVLAGANTYTGTTTINAGTVKAGVNQIGTTSGALGAGTGALTLSNASTLDLNGFNVGVGGVTGNSGTTITNNGGSAATLTVGNSNGGVTFTGSVSAGSGGLSITKAGTGGLTFGSATALGSNINITFTGNTGFGESNGAGTIGNSTNTFIVANGVTIGNFTTSANAGWTLGANVSLGVGSTYTNNSDQTVSQSGNFTSTDSTAVINWTYGFHSNSPTISGNNSGFLGTINIGDNGQSGRDALRLNSLTAGSASAIWHFNGGAAWGGNGVRLNGGVGTYSMGEITSTGGAGNIYFSNVGSILQLGDNTANVASYSGTIGLNGGNGVGITKVGTNTQILTGTNTYTGNTLVSNGTLQLAKQVSLYNSGAAAAWSKTNINVASGATMAFNIGGSGEFTEANVNAILALSDATNNGFNDGAKVGLDTTSGNVTYASAITNPNSGNNSLGLTKLGTNSLTLSNANTYTGTTTVNAGELIVSGSLNGTTNVTVASGATLASGVTGSITTATGGNLAVSGTLAPGDFSSVGTLTLAPGTGGQLSFLSGSTIDFTISGATSDEVSFSSAGDWLSGSGNVTLSLTGITGSDYGNTYTVFHNVSTTGFALAGITGYDSVNYAASFTQVGSDYQLSFTAIPEPNMVTSLLGGVGVLALFRRRGGKSHA
ncbi:MAG: autotransporter-associated beta strand repeat-containing protein [Chthoniobacter sp.]